MKKYLLIVMIASVAVFSTGCVPQTVKDNLHTKAEWARLETKDVVSANSDAVVLEILKRLDVRLLEQGILIPPQLKEILVLEAQRLAKEYATQGVDKAFDELSRLIDQL